MNATVVEKFISKKVLAYCRDCQKAYIRYFTQLDELSNEYFFEENFLLNTTHPHQTIITMWYLIYETMTSKLFVYSFFLQNVYQTFFYDVCVGQPIAFIFVRILMRILFLIKCCTYPLYMIVKRKFVVVFWCAEKNCVLTQVSVTKQKNILTNWKNPWYSIIMFIDTLLTDNW